MFAAKHPNIKKNPSNNENYRYCSVCKSIIGDTHCAETKDNLCKVCAGEVCMKNEKHTTLKQGDKFYCTDCGVFIKDMPEYKRWIDYNIKTDEATIIHL